MSSIISTSEVSKKYVMGSEIIMALKSISININKGEYVSFTLRSSDNAEHPYQAGEVRGIADGWLMCETRNAARASRESEDGEEGEYIQSIEVPTMSKG